MFIELLDVLRCPVDHPQIPLVAAINQRDGRLVTEGVLGCPVCRMEYPILAGAARFAGAQTDDRYEARSGMYGADGALRAGAYVAAEAGKTVALIGGWAKYAPELAALTDARVYAVNPRGATEDSERVGVVYSDRVLPFAASTLHGLAIDEPGWSVGDLEIASRALVSSGRIVAPASAAVPRSIAEIARDDDFWVGEKQGVLVSLERR